MVVRNAPRVRFTGSGRTLQVRALGDWSGDPIGALRECCRAQNALAKATSQAVTTARAAGHSWTEIGDSLGITKQTAWERFSAGARDA